MTPRLTSDARRALGAAGLARRRFLQQSSALVVAFGAARYAGPDSRLSAQGINGRSSTALDAWIAIAADGRVLAYTGKCELGQGLFTAQVQLVAEELDVPLSRVTLTMCDTAVTPDQGTTSGAQSHPANFNHANLALACATAREALVRLASTRLSAPVSGLATADGAVFVSSDPSRRLAYADLVGGRQFMLTLDPAAKRKNPADWKVLGTSVPRLDLPAMVTGQLDYVHTVRVPGMLHGQVVRPPSVGATLARVDEASVRGMAGLVRVVVRRNFIGVVAEKPFQAAQIAAKLQVTWTPGPALPAQAGYYDALRRDRASRDTYLVDSGDVDQTLRGARTVVTATYLSSVSHARIGRQFVRGGRRTAGPRHAVVGDAGGVPDARHRRAPPRAARRRGAGGVHPWFRLLRHQRRRHGDLRCRAALPGGRAAGARAAHAPRRDGVGELRQRVRDRSARRPRRRWLDRRVGLRGVVAGAGRTARLRQPRQRRHRLARGVRPGRSGAADAGPGALDAAQQRSEHGPLVRHRVRRRRL